MQLDGAGYVGSQQLIDAADEEMADAQEPALNGELANDN